MRVFSLGKFAHRLFFVSEHPGFSRFPWTGLFPGLVVVVGEVGLNQTFRGFATFSNFQSRSLVAEAPTAPRSVAPLLFIHASSAHVLASLAQCRDRSGGKVRRFSVSSEVATRLTLGAADARLITLGARSG